MAESDAKLPNAIAKTVGRKIWFVHRRAEPIEAHVHSLNMSNRLIGALMFGLFGLLSGCASASDGDSIGSQDQALTTNCSHIGDLRWIYAGCCARGTKQKEQVCKRSSNPEGSPYWSDTGSTRCAGTTCQQ